MAVGVQTPLGTLVAFFHSALHMLQVWMQIHALVGAGGSDLCQAVDEVLKRYGIAWEEVMAFGDGENDHKMLQSAAIGVAMGNSDPILLAGDFYVTDDADHDGIVSALKHFGLID